MPEAELVLSDARLVLMAPGWSTLQEIRARVKPRHRTAIIVRLNALVDVGLLERREVDRRVARRRRRWVEWRRSSLTWRSVVIGQLGFVWVDGGPLYVRLVASMQHTQHSQRSAIRRERIRAGTFRARGPQRNPRKRRVQVEA